VLVPTVAFVGVVVVVREASDRRESHLVGVEGAVRERPVRSKLSG
jgi:hypothetical protein